MKKLKLDFLHLGNAEVLTRSQLKNVMGGVRAPEDGGPCYYTCPTTEHYADGSSNTYNLEVSSQNPQGYIDNFCTSSVDNGYSTSCSGSCGSDCK